MNDNYRKDNVDIEINDCKINHSDNKNNEINLSKMQNYTNQRPDGDAEHKDILNKIIVDKSINIYQNSTTKLRAEAPPFTPTCKINIENFNCQNVNDNIKQEYCFVNVDLVDLQNNELKTDDLLDNKTNNIHENFETINLNKNIEEPLTQIEIEEPVTEIILPTTTDTTAVVETQRNPRKFLQRFFFDNKTKTAVFISAILICIILISYILL